MSLNAFPPRLRERVRVSEPLGQRTTLRIGGPAQYYVEATSLRDVADTVQAARELGLPLFVLGGGSNLLIADEGVAGVVLSLHGMKKINVFGHKVQVQAGANLNTLVNRCSVEGLAGPQSLAGIPGTVGGALAMNAGCYGGETWNVIDSVLTLDRFGEVRERAPAEFQIGYRHVGLRKATDEWFVGARFRLARGDGEAARHRIKDLLERRIASQPLQLPNAGSVFRNPRGDHAARLIEAAGLKGVSVGGAQVSEKHANFIVNPEGRACAADIEELIVRVREAVLQAFGVELVQEVRIVGESV